MAMPDPTDRHEAGANAPASLHGSGERQDPPVFSLSLRPHRSLSPKGFERVLIFVTIGLAIPLGAFLGTPVGWGLLPFLVAALVGLYAAIQRSYRDARLHEELRLWPDLILVERHETDGRVLRWEANPYWVKLQLRDDGAVESYLTLKGAGREIELGAFLSPEERVDVHATLQRELSRLSQPG